MLIPSELYIKLPSSHPSLRKKLLSELPNVSHVPSIFFTLYPETSSEPLNHYIYSWVIGDFAADFLFFNHVYLSLLRPDTMIYVFFGAEGEERIDFSTARLMSDQISAESLAV